MNYIDMQIYNRDHDRQMEMEADVDYQEEARKQRTRRRALRIRTDAFIAELRAGWKLHSALHDAERAYDSLYQVWKRSDSVTRQAIEPKLCRAMDRVIEVKAELKGGV